MSRTSPAYAAAKERQTPVRAIAAVVVIIMLFMASMYFFTSLAEAPSGWAFYKTHEILSAEGAGSGYQINITLHYGSGTDGPYDVYLNGHTKVDFSDIYFTASDGVTALPYWVQSETNSSTALVWVKIADNLSAGASSVYLWYGKSSASSQSNGAATWIFFDGFESGNPNKWTTAGSDWYVTNSPVVGIGDGSYSAEGVRSSGGGRTLEETGLNLVTGRILFMVATGQNTHGYYPLIPRDNLGNDMYMVYMFNGHFYYEATNRTQCLFPTDTTFTGRTWYNVMATFNFTTLSYDVYVGGTKISGTGITGVLTNKNMRGPNAYDSDGLGQLEFLDDYAVGKYASQEVTQGSWSPETHT